MAIWRELSNENSRAAVLLRRDTYGLYRVSASCAYYAVYHEVTHQLAGSGFTDFGLIGVSRRRNPKHEKLAKLASQNIEGLTTHQRRELRTAVTRLRERRIDADYRPGNTVDKRLVVESLRDMHYALDILSRAKGGAR